MKGSRRPRRYFGPGFGRFTPPGVVGRKPFMDSVFFVAGGGHGESGDGCPICEALGIEVTADGRIIETGDRDGPEP